MSGVVAVAGLRNVGHLVDIAVARGKRVDVAVGVVATAAAGAAVLGVLVTSVSGAVAGVAGVAAALAAHIVNANLARLEAIEEGLKVRNADGEDSEALHQLDSNGGVPDGKRVVRRARGAVLKVNLSNSSRGDAGSELVISILIPELEGA